MEVWVIYTYIHSLLLNTNFYNFKKTRCFTTALLLLLVATATALPKFQIKEEQPPNSRTIINFATLTVDESIQIYNVYINLTLNKTHESCRAIGPTLVCIIPVANSSQCLKKAQVYNSPWFVKIGDDSPLTFNVNSALTGRFIPPNLNTATTEVVQGPSGNQAGCKLVGQDGEIWLPGDLPDFGDERYPYLPITFKINNQEAFSDDVYSRYQLSDSSYRYQSCSQQGPSSYTECLAIPSSYAWVGAPRPSFAPCENDCFTSPIWFYPDSYQEPRGEAKDISRKIIINPIDPLVLLTQPEFGASVELSIKLQDAVVKGLSEYDRLVVVTLVGGFIEDERYMIHVGEEYMAVFVGFQLCQTGDSEFTSTLTT